VSFRNSISSRIHTTSSASSSSPAANAAPSKRARNAGGAAGGAVRTAASAVTADSAAGSGASASTAVPPSSHAMPAASSESSAAIKAVPLTPRTASSVLSVATTPSTAPSVLAPYNRPNARPYLGSRAASARTSSGKVAPIAADGTSISANAISSRSACSNAGWSSNAPAAGPSRLESSGNRYTSPRPLTATTSSSAAYARAGLRMRSPIRAHSPLPTAIPAMNAESTRLDAHTSLPSASRA
jgi:hypothetical protein